MDMLFTGWIRIQKVLARIVELFDNIRSKFLEKWPPKKDFQSTVASSVRYQRIKQFLKNKSIVVIMSSVIYFTQDFKKLWYV